MPYVTVPKDFANVQAKLLFGLTKRQLIAAAAGLGLCLPIYFLLKPRIGEAALYLITLIATPIFLFGFYKSKDGREPEKVFKNYMRVCYFSPRIRPYRAENIYSRMEIAYQIQEVIDDANAQEQKNQEDQKNRSLRRSSKAGKKKDRKAR